MKNLSSQDQELKRPRLPEWMRKSVRENEAVLTLKKKLRSLHLYTVCESAGCPNRGECFQKPTATFLILGNICTRRCRFCGVAKGLPEKPDSEEPAHVAEACKVLGLQHVVITSVTRDDLPDGGASQFVRTVTEIHRLLPEATVEVLIPDFLGNEEALSSVLDSRIDILNHNVETVPSLYEDVRPGAVFDRSLRILKKAKRFTPSVITKSGVMVGLGEREAELEYVFSCLGDAGCDALTIGQYLPPSAGSIPVRSFISPDTFRLYEKKAVEKGIRWVNAGPYVRSSLNAEELMRKMKENRGG